MAMTGKQRAFRAGGAWGLGGRQDFDVSQSTLSPLSLPPSCVLALITIVVLAGLKQKTLEIFSLNGYY
jgi:hypothetical protein